MKTTVNDISSMTCIERKHARRTELMLKNGAGRTDGRVFSLPRPAVGDLSDENLASVRPASDLHAVVWQADDETTRRWADLATQTSRHDGLAVCDCDACRARRR